MKNLKLLAFLLLLAPCSLSLRAQSTGTISSYSRFGLGVLHDQSNGLSKSMGGVGAGVRVGNRINSLNPASYSAIDSLSLILDVGMSGSFGKMDLGAKTVGVNSATLDYVHVGMHIAKRLGLAAGFMPYTSIGYKFYSPERVIGYNQNSSLAPMPVCFGENTAIRLCRTFRKAAQAAARTVAPSRPTMPRC